MLRFPEQLAIDKKIVNSRVTLSTKAQASGCWGKDGLPHGQVYPREEFSTCLHLIVNIQISKDDYVSFRVSKTEQAH
jgi:hypothetical protein